VDYGLFVGCFYSKRDLDLPELIQCHGDSEKWQRSYKVYRDEKDASKPKH
jgi:hypothetical protein